jgi:hypothetical protein
MSSEIKVEIPRLQLESNVEVDTQKEPVADPDPALHSPNESASSSSGNYNLNSIYPLNNNE